MKKKTENKKQKFLSFIEGTIKSKHDLILQIKLQVIEEKTKWFPNRFLVEQRESAIREINCQIFELERINAAANGGAMPRA